MYYSILLRYNILYFNVSFYSITLLLLFYYYLFVFVFVFVFVMLKLLLVKSRQSHIQFYLLSRVRVIFIDNLLSRVKSLI